MRLGAFATIFDASDRVLLCHRRDMDAWNMPGGRVENGETPWDAVRREVLEECGLRCEVMRLTGVYWKPDTEDLVFNFEARALGGEPGTSDESDEVGWFALDALPANLSPRQAERIRDAVLRSPTPFLRTQAGPGARELFGVRT